MRFGRGHARPDPKSWHGPVGLVTAGVLIVAFYISYNALEGLPLQDRYKVSVDVPSSQRIVKTDDVRIGGIRVGQVESVDVETDANGRPFSRIKLKVEKDSAPFPVDSTIAIRPASVLGASYVDVTLGKSEETMPEGGRFGLKSSRPTVELTDLLEIFDRKTRRSIQEAVGGVSRGLAGRGQALNATIAELRRFLPPLQEVATNLAAPGTRLGRFVSAFDDFSAQLAPVSRQLASGFADAGTTFEAMVAPQGALAATIEALPPAETAATAAFARLDPALSKLASLTRQLRPAGDRVAGTIRTIDVTLRDGTRGLRRLGPFSRRLESAAVVLRRFSALFSTRRALRRLTDVIDSTSHALDVILPAQVHCNLFGAWGSSFGGIFAHGFGTNPGVRFPLIQLSTAGAEGETFQSPRPSANLAVNYEAINNANECETGNEPYGGKVQRFNNPPGFQPKAHKRTYQPPGVRELARGAGLYDPIEGAP